MHQKDANPSHLDGAHNLSGKVDSITYLGSIVRIRVDVDGNPITLDIFNERKLNMPVVGEQFQVNFPVDACWIL